MRYIKLDTHNYDTLTLLRKTDTKSVAQRGLCGYMIMAGVSHDPIHGGAFYALRNIEKAVADEQIYSFIPYVSVAEQKAILTIAQKALDGDYDKFAMTEREINANIKRLCEQS